MKNLIICFILALLALPGLADAQQGPQILTALGSSKAGFDVIADAYLGAGDSVHVGNVIAAFKYDSLWAYVETEDTC